MLAAEPSFERIALNRVTFGARDVDEAYVQSVGWEAYVNEQLNAPAEDDDALATHLANQTMRINYRGEDNQFGGWEDVDEDRPLNYLNEEQEALFDLAVNAGTTVSFAELNRIQQEITAASWIRAVHAENQIREFMVDFWHMHFNIGREDSQFGSAVLPVYDRLHIRPYALGNFREMLEANAASTSMLFYLDNAVSDATVPNENYARELLELHTMGEEYYLGLINPAKNSPIGLGGAIGVNAAGYSDEDIIEASKALSGWTVEVGQRSDDGFGLFLPVTGNFIYNEVQHNTEAGSFMGVPLQNLTEPMEQGREVIDIAAKHPGTAEFIVHKLLVRMFGENPPEAVHTRAVDTWMANLEDPDQIKKVMESILLDGPEIGEGPQVKLRRPFERLMALYRTTDTTVNAHQWMNWLFDPLDDGLFTWPTPDGRPDFDEHWLSTSANLTSWNYGIGLFFLDELVSNFTDQTPENVKGSATEVVEYWIGRMIGYEPSAEVTNALIDDATGAQGVITALNFGDAEDIEYTFTRLVGLIATSEEFSYR